MKFVWSVIPQIYYMSFFLSNLCLLWKFVDRDHDERYDDKILLSSINEFSSRSLWLHFFCASCVLVFIWHRLKFEQLFSWLSLEMSFPSQLGVLCASRLSTNFKINFRLLRGEEFLWAFIKFGSDGRPAEFAEPCFSRLAEGARKLEILRIITIQQFKGWLYPCKFLTPYLFMLIANLRNSECALQMPEKNS